MYRYLRIIILLAALTAPHFQEGVEASALAQPPFTARMIIFNANDGSNLTTTNVTFTGIGVTPQGATGFLVPTGYSTTRSILVGNDAAVDATGNSDLLADVTGAAAGIPANGALATTIRIFPGKEYNFDGQYTIISLRSRSTSIPIHVFLSY